MGSIKESAEEYSPPQTLNIADLEMVSVDMDLKDGQGRDAAGEVFNYKFVMVEGKEYRVPGSVLGGLKELLKKDPNMRFFSVSKQGSGMNTRYFVMPAK